MRWSIGSDPVCAVRPAMGEERIVPASAGRGDIPTSLHRTATVKLFWPEPLDPL